MKRYIRYHKKQKRPTYQWHLLKSTKGSVITLLFFMAAVIFLGNTSVTLASRTAQASLLSGMMDKKDANIAQLTAQNQQLKDKLDASQKIVTSQNMQNTARYYIYRYFPQDQWQRATLIANCESHLNSLVVGHNTNGSEDRGIFQINSVHKQQFFEVTGFNYEDGALDPNLNVKFAKWIFDQQGWSPWVCSQLT